ncbi:MAG: 50S ribosomal protein L3 N(5)-glutamine methyltransferase [Gammaproteobacteria bacterium]|nr:50S ribosomal protein L3 N(5)-glutamine methyltransferase [Gammaproteobacteria bacterium]
MTTTVGDLVQWADRRLTQHELCFGHGTDNAFDEAAWLVLSVAKKSAVDLQTAWDIEVSPAQTSTLKTLIEERIRSRKPTAYLINEAHFAGLRFYVDERVIVPRSYLGEFIPDRFCPWFENKSVGRVLDLCTGSGCIAIALAKAFPTADVWASDVSQDALAVAAINLKRHQLEERVHLVRSNFFTAIPCRDFDFIVSNPPYVCTEIMRTLPPEYRAEPPLAMEAGESGLDAVAEIFHQAYRFLTDDGILIVEAGSAAMAVESRYPNVPFTWLTTADAQSGVCLLTKTELVQYFAKLD